MKKKLSVVLSIFVIFIFTFCSSEKDFSLEKPVEDLNKPSNCSLGDFTLFPKDHVPNSDIYVEGAILQNQSNNAKFATTSRNWQGIPSIGKDECGNFYVAWVTGGKGEGNENYLTLAISKDKGISWSYNKLIIYVNPEDYTWITEPNFFNDKFGNLYMSWRKLVRKKNVPKESAVVWYSKLVLSGDDTISFSPPRKIAEGSMLNKPYYSKISDQLFFPIAKWFEGDHLLDQPFIHRGDYGNKNLINFSRIGFIPLDVPLMGIYEHMIVQLSDNSYLGMVRTGNGIYYSKSKDGSIWDKGKKFTDLGATASSRFHLSKLKSGRLILIFNNSINRSNMTVCLSDDDGLTWSHKMILDSSENVSYPDMIETDNGSLNIVYDYARSPKGTIYLVILKEDDIINNITTNIFKKTVSKLQ